MTTCNLCGVRIPKSVPGWSWRILCDDCAPLIDQRLIEATEKAARTMIIYRQRHMGERPPEEMQAGLNRAYGRLRAAIRKHAGPP